MSKGATKKMQRWYQHPDQTHKWGNQLADLGLFPTEAALIEKYFKPDSRVLNIGCGGGRETLALAKNHRVVAVDFMMPFCMEAAKRLQKNDLAGSVLQMNALELAFSDSAFDHVVMVGQLIGQIPKRENRIKALREIHRVLKPSATAIISTNAIELGFRYRAYFALVNRIRQVYNPHGLEPDDAFIFHEGRRFSPFADKSRQAVFHWYRTVEFLKDARSAGFELLEYQRRWEFEKHADRSGGSTGGETFYALKKS